VQICDEWGNLLRAEGQGEHFRLEARAVTAEGVAWWALGKESGKSTQVPLHLPGRVVKVAPHERLSLEEVKRAFETVITTQKLPEDMPRRALSGDHGRMYMMVVGDDEPRPAIGWTDIARRISDVPADAPVVAALAEPGRVLIGVFGVGDRLTITVRESRGEQSWERRVHHPDRSKAKVELPLPQGILEVAERDVLDRGDALVALESIFRFDVPAPGFSWSLDP